MNVHKRSMSMKLVYEKNLQNMKDRFGEETTERIRKFCVDGGVGRSRKSIKKSMEQLRDLGVSLKPTYLNILRQFYANFFHKLS